MALVNNLSPVRCMKLLAEADALGAYSLALQWLQGSADRGDPWYGVVASYDRDEILDAVVEYATSRPSSRQDIPERHGGCLTGHSLPGGPLVDGRNLRMLAVGDEIQPSELVRLGFANLIEAGEDSVVSNEWRTPGWLRHYR